MTRPMTRLIRALSSFLMRTGILNSMTPFVRPSKIRKGTYVPRCRATAGSQVTKETMLPLIRAPRTAASGVSWHTVQTLSEATPESA